VTKGGFYGYFADRGALLDAMLDAWERECVDDVFEQVARAGGDLLDQARLAGYLTFSSERLFPIDLAIRDWARRDRAVADRLRRVDNRRMQLLRDAISTFCTDPDEVEARSLLAFCLAIGTHLVAVDHPGRTRPEVNSRASALLLNRSAGWPSE
jgi:AcrR family transcriptional regulator